MKHHMIKNTFLPTLPEGKVIPDTREFPDGSLLIKQTSGVSRSRSSNIAAEQDCLTLNQQSLETHRALILVINCYVIWCISSLLSDEVAFHATIFRVKRDYSIAQCTEREELNFHLFVRSTRKSLNEQLSLWQGNKK